MIIGISHSGEDLKRSLCKMLRIILGLQNFSKKIRECALLDSWPNSLNPIPSSAERVFQGWVKKTSSEHRDWHRGGTRSRAQEFTPLQRLVFLCGIEWKRIHMSRKICCKRDSKWSQLGIAGRGAAEAPTFLEGLRTRTGSNPALREMA